MLQILQPFFDPTFSNDSYGFRPKRSAHQAIQRAQEHILAGYDWVVDLDLERFFDRVKDKQMVRLIRRVGTGGRTGDDFAGELSVQTPAPTNQPGEDRRGATLGPQILGYTVTASRKLKVAPQSLRRLHGRIRALCRQARGWRLDRLIETLRPIIRGWIAYFQLSEVKVAFVRLDEWLRRRLRCTCGGSGSDLSPASAV